MKSQIYKFRAPSILLKQGGGGGYQYSKWNYDFVIKLKESLKNSQKLIEYFTKYPDFKTIPISITYSKLVPKTSRISKIFSYGKKPKQIGSEYIVINEEIKKIRLVYECTEEEVVKTIEELKELLNMITNSNFQKDITNVFQKRDFKKFKPNEKIEELFRGEYKNFKTSHKKIIDDFIFIEDIDLKNYDKFEESQIFSFLPLKENEEIVNLLKSKGIDFNFESYLASEFWNLDKFTINKIIELYPFLFSFVTADEEIEYSNMFQNYDFEIDIEKMKDLKFNKTIIGVFDSASNLPDEFNILKEKNNLLPVHKVRDEIHGTMVTSIIGANDIFNDWKDNLGNFQIKLFEVLPQGKILTSYLMREIEKVISENFEEIKVWNLSIGNYKNGNKISIFGRLIDSLQNKYGVQFIIAAGNEGSNNLVAPADSLTSISVGSFFNDQNNEFKIIETSGSSTIFGVFKKPDIYEFGSSINDPVKSLFGLDNNLKPKIASGTSFSAPLATRKFAFLKEKFNLENYTVRALMNYLAALNGNKYCDLTLLNSENEVFLFIEGKINYGEKKEIEVFLPITEKKLDFAASYSISYNPPNSLDLGDEYCPLDISFRIAEIDQNKRSNLIQIDKKENKIHGLTANETDLRKYFGKYNPNTVLMDTHFMNLKQKKVKLDSKKLSFVIERVDLLDDGFGVLEYGVVVHLKEFIKNSLNNFYIENEAKIIDNYSKVELWPNETQEIEDIDLES